MAGSKRKKMAKGDVVFNAVIYTFFALFALITLYPVINILAYSFNNYLDSFRGHIHFIPRKFDLHNYVDALQLTGIRRGLLTSFARTVIGTITTLAANALPKLRNTMAMPKMPFTSHAARYNTAVFTIR